MDHVVAEAPNRRTCMLQVCDGSRFFATGDSTPEQRKTTPEQRKATLQQRTRAFFQQRVHGATTANSITAAPNSRRHNSERGRQSYERGRPISERAHQSSDRGDSTPEQRKNNTRTAQNNTDLSQFLNSQLAGGRGPH